MALLLAAHSSRYCRLLGVSTVACNAPLGATTQNAIDILHALARAHDVPVYSGAARPLVRPGLAPGCPEIHGDSGLDGPQGGPLLPRCGVAARNAAQGSLPQTAVSAMYAAIARAAAEAAAAEAGGEEEQAEEQAPPVAAPCGGPAPPPPPPPRVALVCTGALTNAALLLSLYPDVSELCEAFVMGGATTGVGNTSPCAEFNIQMDPEALAVLLRAAEPVAVPAAAAAAVAGSSPPPPPPPPRPLQLTLVPLEVTHTALVTPEVLKRLGCGGGSVGRGGAEQKGEEEEEGGQGAGGSGSSALPSPSPFRRMLRDLLLFFAGSYKRTFAFDHPPLHDPCAVLAALAPSLFVLRRERLEVSLSCPLTAGLTVLDRWRQLGRPDNVTIAHEMDVPAFWEAVAMAVNAADRVSPLNNRKQQLGREDEG
jgi:inosine-uridine nucleoside N-ribohydrolase